MVCCWAETLWNIILWKKKYIYKVNIFKKEKNSMQYLRWFYYYSRFLYKMKLYTSILPVIWLHFFEINITLWFFYHKKDSTFLLGKGETLELHMQLLEGDSKNRGDGVTYPVWSTSCSTLVFSEVRMFLEKKKHIFISYMSVMVCSFFGTHNYNGFCLGIRLIFMPKWFFLNS